MYGYYIFRMPKDTPELTHETLHKYIGTDDHRDIGTTVHLRREADGSVQFALYWTTLAKIYPDRVEFTEHGDRHGATREWLSKIVSDNGIASCVWRPRASAPAGASAGLGQIRYGIDRETEVVVSRVGDEAAYPVLDFDAIGGGGDGYKPGDFRGPTRYTLQKFPVREVYGSVHWTRQVSNAAKNEHRAFWGFPPLNNAETVLCLDGDPDKPLEGHTYPTDIPTRRAKDAASKAWFDEWMLTADYEKADAAKDAAYAASLAGTRLEYLRGEIEAERISTGELIELQNLVPYIDGGDVQLLEWAGVPEFPDSEPAR